MRIAVYAGSFDPVTRGHLSVVERAARLFDRLVVLVAVHPDKQALFSMEERAQMIREATADLAGVDCACAEGFVVDFARRCGARYLVRGVRGSTDAEGEIALARQNLALAPEIETVFVPAHPELSEVSSSTLKALARQGAGLSKFCSDAVAARLRERLGAPAAAGCEASHG